MDAGIQDQPQLVGEDVSLTLPPFSEYLRTVRLVAADAALRAGLDYDEVEDFRIAVDELCHLLMSSTDHEISVAFGVSGASVRARGRARPRSTGEGSALAPLSELSRTIVTSVTDHHDLVDRSDEIGFVIVKQTHTAVDR
jgi:hypothetical protein